MTAGGDVVHIPWGVDDSHDLARDVPRLKLVTATPFLTIPELVERLSTSKAQLTIAHWIGRFGWYQRSMQHYRYEF